MTLLEQAYSKVTGDIRVSVLPLPLLDQSNPNSNIYAFSYTITIENLGKEAVQLLERHWLIKSGGEDFTEVVGPGVIGQQPTLKEKQSFTYTSGAVIEDPFGSMQGSYTFRSENGKYFQVAIPKFDLFYPLVIH